MKHLAAFCFSCVSLAAAAFEVENVSARQRWPWNGLVDITYDIAGATADMAFVTDVTAEYNAGSKKIVGKTYRSDPVGKPGTNTLVWDFGADAPNVKADDLRISITVTPMDDTSEVYCVIDVAGGKNAVKYPVRYSRLGPAHTPRCTNDVCKLTEIWLKRVHPASRNFTPYNFRTPASNNKSFYCRLTKDYYLGVFEITQQQWYQMNGDWPSQMSNELWRATRPMDRFYPYLLFGNNGYTWPDDKSLKSGCLLEKLRNKTGLMTLNLPTEAQWRFALTAGPTKGSEIYRYRRPDGTVYALDEIARYSGNAGTYANYAACDLDNGSAAVGMYAPNNFGFYDMIGNVSESLLDTWMTAENLHAYYTGNAFEFPIEDPDGVSQAVSKSYNNGSLRTVDGGWPFRVGKDYHTLWNRGASYYHYCTDNQPSGRGLRLCVTCE